REAIRAYGRVKRSHEQRGGDALAADVAHGEGELAFTHHEEVIVVARDGARRLADAVEFESGHLDLTMREEIVLDLLRNLELALHALLFALLFEQAFERFCHGVKRGGERTKLIAAENLDAMCKVAAVNSDSGAVEIADGVSDGAVETNRHHKRDELDD